MRTEVCKHSTVMEWWGVREMENRFMNCIHWSFGNRLFIFILIYSVAKHYECNLTTGCPKKRGISVWQAVENLSKYKCRVSFEKFRKFPFQWAQKLPNFVEKRLRKMRSNMATPLKKWHYMGSPIDSSFAHSSKLDKNVCLWTLTVLWYDVAWFSLSTVIRIRLSINIFMELQANDESTG